MTGPFTEADAAGRAALPPRPMFRADAVRRYAESQHKTILPRLLFPRVFVCLWVLFGLSLFAGMFIAWHSGARSTFECRGVSR